MAWDLLISEIKAERETLHTRILALDRVLEAIDALEDKPKPAAAVSPKKTKSTPPKGTSSKGQSREPKEGSVRRAALFLLMSRSQMSTADLLNVLKHQFPKLDRDALHAHIAYRPAPIKITRRDGAPWLFEWDQAEYDAKYAHWGWSKKAALVDACRCSHPMAAHNGGVGQCIRAGCGCAKYGTN